MKRLHIILLALCTLTAGHRATAKENMDLIRANYYYSHFSYAEAIPYYEKLAGGEVTDPAVYANLGDCYRLTGNAEKAAIWYDKAVQMKGCSPVVMLRYGQVLMQLNRYADAEKWLKEYQKTYKNERRVANMIAGCAYAKQAMSDVPAGNAVPMGFNTDGSEFAPTLWNGKLVFTSDTVIDLKKKKDSWTGKSYLNIYSVQCDDKGNCGSEINVVADAKKLNIKYHNGPATFSADGKQMYYTRTKYKERFWGGKSVAGKDSVVPQEIMIATGYDDSERAFKEIVPFAYNSDAYSVEHPAVSPDGSIMAFVATMPKGYGGSDIYLCRKNGEGWGAPVNAGTAINTEGDELFPFWASNTMLCFSSDGHKGFGGLDVYTTRWNAGKNTFTTPENAGMPLNSSYDDISLAVAADGNSAYFSSNRPGNRGGDNIYFFKKYDLHLQVNVVDDATKQPIAGAKVVLLNGAESKDLIADKSGSAVSRVRANTSYSVKVTNEDYEPREMNIGAIASGIKDTVIKEIALIKVPPKPKDTVKAVASAPPAVIRHESVMDSPGVQTFELDKIYEVGHFYFDYNQADLKGKNKVFLDTIMTQLRRHPTMRIELRAHTDCRGSAEYNQKLSEKRAKFVVNYLVQHGIKASRLEAKGLGDSEPLARCPNDDCAQCQEEQHYLNRVLEFRVLKL